MEDIIKQFKHLRDELELKDTDTAILVLALAVKESATFSRNNAENFGHELAMALKNVLSEGVLSVDSRE